MAKSYGARPHPNSGAGTIKEDASSATEVLSFKTTGAKGHRITVEEMLLLLKRAQRMDKEPLYVLDFIEHGLRVEIRPSRI